MTNQRRGPALHHTWYIHRKRYWMSASGNYPEGLYLRCIICKAETRVPLSEPSNAWSHPDEPAYDPDEASKAAAQAWREATHHQPCAVVHLARRTADAGALCGYQPEYIHPATQAQNKMIPRQQVATRPVDHDNKIWELTIRTNCPDCLHGITIEGETNQQQE